MADSLRTGFLTLESCTIRSAITKNPTAESNITSIGNPVAKLWPFLYIQNGRQLPSWITEIRKVAPTPKTLP